MPSYCSCTPCGWPANPAPTSLISGEAVRQEAGAMEKRWVTRRSPTALSCPSWARTRTLLIPSHFGFRRRPTKRAFVVWTVPSPSSLHGQVAPAQSLHLPHLRAWLGVASEGSADFESIHA